MLLVLRKRIHDERHIEELDFVLYRSSIKNRFGLTAF